MTPFEFGRATLSAGLLAAGGVAALAAEPAA
jgi:hypothetical protein